MEGRAVSARRDLGRHGRELRPVLRACDGRRALSFPGRRGCGGVRAHQAGGTHEPGVALLFAGRATRTTVWVACRRTVRTGEGTSLQPGEAAARPVRTR